MAKKHNQLEMEMMRKFAGEALRTYGFRKPSLTLLGNVHNTTYRVETSDGSRYVLKLHRPANVKVEYVRSEMIWLEGLSRDTDLLVPRPIRNRDRQFVGEVGDGPAHRWYRLMSWVPGRRFARGMRAVHFEKLGELLASIQLHGMTFRPPAEFSRPWFGRERLKSRMRLLRGAAKDGLLDRKQLRLFEKAFERADAAMAALGNGRSVFGLIHGDLGYGNYLFHQGRAGAIDFEAGGFGHFLEDLVEPVHFAQHVPHFSRLCQDVLRGYQRVRPLEDRIVQHFPAFIDAAAVTTSGYIAGQASRRHELPNFAKYFCKHLPKIRRRELRA